MTSKSLFSKKCFICENCKRNTWAIVLSFFAFFCSLTLPVVMVIQNFESEYGNNKIDTDFKRIFDEISNILTLDNFVVKVIIVGIAIFASIIIFSYLHSKKQIDFYHSLPIKRTTLFANNFISGIIAVIPAYLVNVLLSCIIVAATGYSEAILSSEILFTIFVNIVYFLIIYAIGVLSSILCGNIIISALMMAWISFSPTILILFIEGLKGKFYSTYVFRGTEIFAFKFSPIISYFMLHDYYRSNNYNSEISIFNEYLPTVLTYIVAFVIIVALCVILNKVRKSESAGNAVAFSAMKIPLKIYMTTVFTLGIGILLGEVVNEIWLYIGFVLGGIFCHCLVEVIYEFDIKAMFKNIKHFVVFTAFFVVFIVCFRMDVFGYNTRVIDIDKIAGVQFYDYSYSYSGRNEYLTDSENIQRAWKISKLAVENLKNDQEEFVNSYYESYEITFKKKSGRIFARRYYLAEAPQEIIDLSNEIMYSQEFIQKNNKMYDVDYSDEDLSLNVSSYYSSKHLKNTEDITIYDVNQIKEIVEAYKDEYSKVGIDYLKHNVPMLSVSVLTDDDYTVSGVYPKFTKTLELINKYTDYEDVVFSVEDIEKVYLDINCDIDSHGYYIGDYDYLNLEIYDRDEIEDLTKNAVNAQAVYASQFNIECDERVNAEIYFKSGASVSVKYLIGETTDNIISKYSNN